jgi:predicted XRE-type DNA-binding protein
MSFTKDSIKKTYPKIYKLLESEEFKEMEREETIALMLAVKIRQIMEEKHLTQTILAQKMGVTQPQVARLVSGRGFSWKTLQKFCIATDTRIDLSST